MIHESDKCIRGFKKVCETFFFPSRNILFILSQNG